MVEFHSEVAFEIVIFNSACLILIAQTSFFSKFPFFPHSLYFISCNNNFYIQVLPYFQAKPQSKKIISKAHQKERKISLRAGIFL